MNLDNKIYIAGHRGLVGSAIWKQLKSKGYTNLIGKTSSELNLMDAVATQKFFEEEKPDYVFLAAAHVGGIMANNTYRADFIYNNLQIQQNVIYNAYQFGVKKLLFLGSTCIYPKEATQPINEDELLTNVLEYTNEPYAIAKIAGIKLCESFNIQYDTNFISVMPTNLYGPNDNYDLQKSHVLPALIRKMHLGKALEQNDWNTIRRDLDQRPIEGVNGKSSEQEVLNVLQKYGIHCLSPQSVSVALWGSGAPLREFLHSDDMAEACVFLMENINFSDIVSQRSLDEIRNTHINIGSGTDLTIRELALEVKRITGFQGELNWDASKPDGTMRKLMDVSRLEKLGWKYRISLAEGIESVYDAYCENL